MFKEQKGITLVALVITIIVLLILAGVSLSLVAGDKGVANRAKKAVESTEEAQVHQELQLSIAEAQMAYFEDWAKDRTAGAAAVEASSYYVKDEFYANNCTGASSVETSYDATSKIVSIKYTSKKGNVYSAAFYVDSPANSFKMEKGNGPVTPLTVTPGTTGGEG